MWLYLLHIVGSTGRASETKAVTTHSWKEFHYTRFLNIHISSFNTQLVEQTSRITIDSTTRPAYLCRGDSSCPLATVLPW